MAATIEWWLALLVMGVGFLPFTNTIFRNFRDHGWLFSKVLALLLSGWLLFCLVVCGALPFTQRSALLVAAALSALCWCFWLFSSMRPSEGAIRRDNSPRLLIDPSALKLIAVEEALFLAFLLLAIYVIGFRPEAYGTEKFMDYAFLTSMARSTTLPFEDTWFAGETINYYYGGQYMAAYLMKLTGVSAGLAYNVMRAVVTSFSFVLPFSLVYQMLEDKLLKWHAKKDIQLKWHAKKDIHLKWHTKKDIQLKWRDREDSRARLFPWLGGALGGLAVAFCGNGHYLVYGIVKPIIAAVRGEYYSYWFPDSTRYIGYDPDLPDKTIHEFPSYSSILGDLHAHYVNLIFVIAIVAVVYAWAQKWIPKPQTRFHADARGDIFRKFKSGCGNDGYSDEGRTRENAAHAAENQNHEGNVHLHENQNRGDNVHLHKNQTHADNTHSAESQNHSCDYADMGIKSILQAIFCPEVLLIGLFTGVFRWTNAADFAIYYVVCGSILFFVNLRIYRGRFSQFLIVMAGQAVCAFGIGFLAALPFTLTFKSFTHGIHLTHSHSPLYQLVILWGLPAAVFVGYILDLFLVYRSQRFAATSAPNADSVKSTAVTAGVAGAIKDIAIGAIKDDATDAIKDTAIGAIKDDAIDAIKDTAIGAIKDDAIDAIKDTAIGAIKDDAIDAIKDTAIGAIKDTATDAETDAVKAYAAGDAAADFDANPAVHTSSRALDLPDLAALLFGLCAAGLVLLPELVYVKDIYGEQHYRANTMFKLTYEAFILFAIMMAYVLVRALYLSLASPSDKTCADAGNIVKTGKNEEDIISDRTTEDGISDRTAENGISDQNAENDTPDRTRAHFTVRRIAVAVGIFLLVLTAGYTIKGVDSWFGSVLSPSNRISSDASVFVAENFESDYGAIDYLNTEIAGQPTILEAPGDSYSDYERVSVATGLPTVAGWYVHEWLWRDSHELMDERREDIQTIFTSTDTELVKNLIKKYDIEYLYIGRLERDKYPDIQEAHLQTLGTTVYSDENGTYILKVS